MTNNWNQIKLDKLFTKINDRNKILNDNVLTISAVKGLVNQESYFNKRVASNNLSNYYLLKKGDFAYNRSYSQGYPIGVVKLLEQYNAGVVSPIYICFRAKDQSIIDVKFYSYLFESGILNNILRTLSHEGARNHGLLNINTATFFNIEVPFPPLKVQNKVSDILSSLDNAIQKADQIAFKTEMLKSGLMNELLRRGLRHKKLKNSKLGEIPDDWNIHRIDKIAKISTGITPSRSNKDYYIGNIPWIKSNQVNFSEILKSDESVSDLAVQQCRMKLIKPGAILIAMYGQGVTRGRCAVLKVEATTNQAIASIEVNAEVNNLFLYYFLQSKYEYLRSLGHGGNQLNLNTQIIGSIEIPIPSYQEQQKIVEVLFDVDKKLDADKKEVEYYRKLKMGILQDIFNQKVQIN